MPQCLAIGISKDEFMSSTPKDLEPYFEAERLKLKQRDWEAWQFGHYTLMATSVAVSSSLYGKKSNVKYFKESLMQMAEKEQHEKELSEVDKKKQREKLLMALQLMQANFELNHPKGEQEE